MEALHTHKKKHTHTLLQQHECLMNDYEYPIKNLISVILNTSLNYHNIIFYATLEKTMPENAPTATLY